MSRKKQPYMPLYAGDWLSSNKLKICSSSAHGLLINIMLLMHKEEHYGKILLKQKFKQKENTCLNLCLQLAKLLPFDLSEIEQSLTELIEEKVLIIEGDFLICERMVEDKKISDSRSKAGKKGGLKTQNNKNFPLDFASNFAKANTQANSDIESDIDINNEYINKKRILKEKKTDNLRVVEEIYNEYPKKENPLEAQSAILAALEIRSAEYLKNKTKDFCNHTKKWQPDKLRFIPKPSNWFAKGSFDNDLSVYDKYLIDSGIESEEDRMFRIAEENSRKAAGV